MKLKEKGFKNAMTSEGVLVWTYHADYLVKRKEEGDISAENNKEIIQTNLVHTFAKQWDSASSKYISIQFSFWEAVGNAVAGYFS